MTMPRLTAVLLSSVLGILLGGSAANAVPIFDPASGHYYELVTTDTRISWDQANAAANARTFAGLQGHLATVTSADEQAFIGSTFDFTNTAGNGIYIGGF